jgi:hypothetical protein
VVFVLVVVVVSMLSLYDDHLIMLFFLLVLIIPAATSPPLKQRPHQQANTDTGIATPSKSAYVTLPLPLLTTNQAIGFPKVESSLNAPAGPIASSAPRQRSIRILIPRQTIGSRRGKLLDVVRAPSHHLLLGARMCGLLET